MFYYILIGIILIATIIAIIKLKKSNEKRNTQMSKMDAIAEIQILRTNLSNYKAQCIDGKSITDDNATPLDNIAYFMTIEYPKLSDNRKSECNYALFVYSDNLMELINQILKEPEEDDPKETDEWYKLQADKMGTLYLQLIRKAYPEIVKNHEEELLALSTYNYMEIQKQIELWMLNDEYSVNESLKNNKGEKVKDRNDEQENEKIGPPIGRQHIVLWCCNANPNIITTSSRSKRFKWWS